MWQAKDKRELAIEVWEKLDCESVGAVEIVAIEDVVRDVYGESAVESPMRIARMLADEGAVLRHSEIMELFVRRYEAKPYTAEFRNIFRLDELSHALSSIRRIENLRKKFTADGDKEGLRLIRERTIQARKALGTSAEEREIWQWLGVWLTTPDAFETWLALRRRTAEFNELFGDKLDR